LEWVGFSISKAESCIGQDGAGGEKWGLKLFGRDPRIPLRCIRATALIVPIGMVFDEFSSFSSKRPDRVDFD
jgi:hypothetical protein